MSYAPKTLRDLRAYLEEKTGNDEPGNFGIARGKGTNKNTYGYHFGEDLIFLEGYGMGWKDYSVRRARDKAGLSDAASAMDIKLPVPQLKKLRAFLVAEAKAGRADDLAEIIGPGDDGRGYRWAKPNWEPQGPRPKGDGHEWHIHLSWLRDSEHRDKIALFEPHFGKRTVVDPPVAPTTPPAEDDDVNIAEVMQAVGVKANIVAGSPVVEVGTGLTTTFDQAVGRVAGPRMKDGRMVYTILIYSSVLSQPAPQLAYIDAVNVSGTAIDRLTAECAAHTAAWAGEKVVLEARIGRAHALGTELSTI